MSTTKVTRNMLDTGIADSSNATAITIDSSENCTFAGTLNGLTLASGGVTGPDSSNFTLNTANSFRLNIDSNASGTGESFIVGHNQTAINQSNVLLKVQEDGKVGIGTSSPSAPLHIVTTTDDAYSLRLEGATNNSANYHGIGFSGESANTKVAILFKDIANSFSRGDLLFCVNNDADQTNVSDTDVVMTLKGDGAVGIGTTAPSASNITRLYLTGGESVMAVRNTTATDASHRVQIEFFDNAGTRRGYVATSNASTQYVTSSDYRLKEVTESLTNGLDRVKQLNPVKFKWTDTGNIQEGFIAHEVQEICPEAVSGEKDAVHEDGTLALQGMDYGRITPLLVKAIQELSAEVEELKSKLNES